MKLSNLFLLIFVPIFFSAKSHVQKDSSGVFLGYQNLKRGQGLNQKSKLCPSFEKKDSSEDNKVDSIVFDIKNSGQFKLFILKNSMYKPVALKIYKSDQVNTQEGELVKVFQDVAEVFSSGMVFAGLDLSKNNGKFSDTLNLKDEDLPLIIFFKDGQPQVPFISANQHKNYLVKLIEARFFKK